ncbi:MAG TPA: DUF1822 family protein [Leptolyngbyaceae cyanobacterium]
MSNVSNAFPELMDIDFDEWQSNRVGLSQAEVDWAVQICQSIADETQQWQTFLRAMALRGFCQWLAAGAVELNALWDETQPPPRGINCRVNGFRLCLLVMGGLSDEIISIPQNTVEGSNSAHLYVLIEVQEEFNQVSILGGLRHDQLRAYQQQTSLVLNPDATYTVPVHLFDASPEQILLYLTCLNPAMLESLAVPAQPALPKLNLSGVINVGRWLQDQLDAVTEELSWILLPPLATEPALAGMRSLTEELEAILTELEPVGVTVSPLARSAYRDLQSQGLPFRLYALIWPVFESATPEWSLFLFLGPTPGEQLPPGTRLTISDAGGTLAEQTLTPESVSAYLYAQVFGTWEEQFTAAIALPDGTTLTLPTFVFEPDA